MFTFLGGIILFMIIVGFFLASKIVYICAPNQVLIFSGRRRRVRKVVNGKTVKGYVGYRLVKGGTGFRWPLLETVNSLDLTNMNIDLVVDNAYSKGAIPLTVQGIANVKIAGTEPIIRNAIERLLGVRREDIIRIARETLEGNLRGVLATLTPEEVNEDRIKFARMLQEEVDDDLAKLGLVLDSLKIQNISDNVGYLEAIGRIKNAEAQRDARVAAARNWAEAAVRDANNKRDEELKKIEVKRQTFDAEMERRLTDALTKREAVIQHERAQVAALVARTQAEIEVQKARYEQMRHKLTADVIKPAEAQMKADYQKAEAAVARRIADGQATAEALRAIIETWNRAGDSARTILLLQKLDSILPKTLEVLGNVKVDRITYLPDGGSSTGAASARLVEEIKAGTGVDISRIGKRLEGK